MRAFVILAALALCPGCLAAAVAGGAYLLAKDSEADAERDKARLDYVARRRAAGATTEEILAEIRATDPEWAEDIEDGDFVLEVRAG